MAVAVATLSPEPLAWTSVGDRDVVCVDLDGTLIVGDLFWESVLTLISQRPLLAFFLPIWALRGRAFLKRQVAIHVPVNAARLTYNTEVLERLRLAHSDGHHLVLATGSDELHAAQVSAHLGIFSTLFASNGVVNLTGRRKAERLREQYGHGRFDYLGNDWADVPVWEVARTATVVGGPARLRRHVQERLRDIREVGTTPNRLEALVRALRLHQWAKNLLLFVPLVLSHSFLDLSRVASSVVAFFAFGFCASAIYILNDLFDIQADRAHPTKRRRPFAAGELTVPTGIVAAAALFSVGAAIALAGTPATFLFVLLLYMAITTAYSARLKREPVLDVFVLAGLYVLRILGGGVAIDITISNWLLGFALFLFLSLAFVKRYTELVGQNGHMPGRGYSAPDQSWMQSIGTTAGYMSVVILALYVNSTDVASLYDRPRVIWLACPVLLYWVTRLWFRAGRQEIHHDPVVEALKDPTSWACAAAALGIVLAAM